MNESELKNLKKLVFITAKYYSREIGPDVISMMAEDLCDLNFQEVTSAYLKYRRDPKNKTMPLPAQIREIIEPMQTHDQQARELTSRILDAISRYGYNNPEHAKSYIGEIGWTAVRNYGGWQNLCEGMGVRFGADSFSAQVRELLKGRLQHGENFSEETSLLAFSSDKESLNQSYQQLNTLLEKSFSKSENLKIIDGFKHE